MLLFLFKRPQKDIGKEKPNSNSNDRYSEKMVKFESGSAPAEEKREDDLWLLDSAADTAKVKKEEPALVKEEPVTDDEEQEEEDVAAEALAPPPPNFRYRCTKCDNMEVFSTRADFDTHALMRHESQVLSKKILKFGREQRYPFPLS